MEKIIIPLFVNDVAPRFDLASEVVIIIWDKKTQQCDKKILVLPKSSAEQLCHLILTEEAHTLICGGIEETHYQYLTWKQVQVFDSIMGNWRTALDAYRKGALKSAEILCNRDY